MFLCSSVCALLRAAPAPVCLCILLSSPARSAPCCSRCVVSRVCAHWARPTRCSLRRRHSCLCVCALSALYLRIDDRNFKIGGTTCDSKIPHSLLTTQHLVSIEISTSVLQTLHAHTRARLTLWTTRAHAACSNATAAAPPSAPPCPALSQPSQQTLPTPAHAPNVNRGVSATVQLAQHRLHSVRRRRLLGKPRNKTLATSPTAARAQSAPA